MLWKGQKCNISELWKILVNIMNATLVQVM